mmetsp:Transcript_4623/g.6616  ORF Transcript_4623/g.6616 Transcript_4623/m.6616 type:complete len:142 (+) Transcript_4623:456-881(+)
MSKIAAVNISAVKQGPAMASKEKGQSTASSTKQSECRINAIESATIISAQKDPSLAFQVRSLSSAKTTSKKECTVSSPSDVPTNKTALTNSVCPQVPRPRGRKLALNFWKRVLHKKIRTSSMSLISKGTPIQISVLLGQFH